MSTAGRLKRDERHRQGLADLWAQVSQRTARQGADLAHDLPHLRRVWNNASLLAARAAEDEGWTIDLDVLEAAVALHDIGRGQEQDGERSEVTSAAIAEDMLRHHGLGDLVWPVCEAILSHSWSADREASTAEARILQDADRLDALGAIGVARALLMGSSMATPELYCEDDPYAEKRDLDDHAYIMDHFPAKLFRLAEQMVTPFGRAEGERRTRIVRAFYEALLRDAGVARGDGQP
ncbi:MAG: HD domain-containing protein [Deltaproteobacteria bacterium]|nr:MAG: HD domain-containing protein [Deltaproteobacteria bacterium]